MKRLTNHWTVPFLEYLDYPGVKEGIRVTKTIAKKATGANVRLGKEAEAFMTQILTEHPSFTVKQLNPQMDVGFGADLQLSYTEDGKNYSFFADVTTAEKKGVEYMTMTGSITSDIKKAFVYETEYCKVTFGLKMNHASHFKYERPVVVLRVRDFVPASGVARTHINNIGNVLISLNSLLDDMGYGARASRNIRPNPKKFPTEFNEYKLNETKGGN